MIKVLRFLVSGGIVATINLTVLWLATEALGIMYLVSVGIAFFVSVPISFFLQKVWTFGDRRVHIVIRQSFAYVLVQGLNLCLDLVIVYLLVINGVWYILAQTIAFVILAVISFLIFKYLLFASTDAVTKKL